ncbi:hypothetical protein D1AOALGA4SA_9886 [Olavius algarvensis Delta 1 endosymbiont]|nr:hypothetical protein D1AOALGA4SA_9886 [Olavius algarvensis Delta 1 endosymbiont]
MRIVGAERRGRGARSREVEKVRSSEVGKLRKKLLVHTRQRWRRAKKMEAIETKRGS